jgi:hypothetical protein
MGYAPLLPALICVLLAAVIALGSVWIAREARRLRMEESNRLRTAPGLPEDAVTPRASDITLFVRFERMGEDIMRGVLTRYAPDGTLPADEVRAAVEPMVDSLRLATHADVVEAAPESPRVHSPVDGGLVTCLQVKARTPLLGISDPTHRSSVAAFLRTLGSLDPAKLLSVKLAEAELGGGGARELRPLHR